MPKGRYRIMANYMPKVGTRGLDMMFRTCTVQVNLDFGDEADMVKKLRVSLALQPVATALFASSPFTEGKLNGFQSMRSEIWRDTDKARSGMLAFAFDEGMSYEAYVDWALDVPMYFVKRGAGLSRCRRRLVPRPARRHAAAAAGRACHHVGLGQPSLDACFPRSGSSASSKCAAPMPGPPAMLNALPAFWVGLLYDQAALDAAWDLVKGWSAAGAPGAARRGAEARPFGQHRRAAGRRGRARGAGPVARGPRPPRPHGRRRPGRDRSISIPLMEIAARDRTLAQDLAGRFRDEWGGRIEPVFTDLAV